MKFWAGVRLLITLSVFQAATSFGQITIPDTDPLPAESVPFSGTFYSALNPTFPPLPANINGLAGWNISGNASNVWILDDMESGFSGRHALDDSPPGPPGDGGGSPDTNTFVPFVAPTNGLLWLSITNVADGWVGLSLNSGTDTVYEILSKTNLADTNWSIEGELWPTNTSVMPFTVPQAGRSNLFIWARDWTGVTEGTNTVPSWWFYWFYGANAFSNSALTLSDTNLDSQGNALSYDYENGFDPNVISFNVVVTNNYFSASTAPVQLNVSAGVPDYVAISVDDTNYQADATWMAYSSSNITVNLGSTQGWHTLWIGLKGLPASATQTWQYKRVKLDTTPPALVVTNPIVSTVSVPLLQVSGYCNEALSKITYDLTNANGLVTNLDAGVTSQFYSTNTFEFTTNFFEAVDIPLTNGVNTITLHATDLAGNVTTTNVSVTLDYSSRTNPPVVSLYWPQNGTLICNSNYTWRGWVDDPTAIVSAQLVDTNGTTNVFNGIVERDGNFWVENLPLSGGTNWLTLTVTDSAGNVATTNITVTPSAVTLTIDPPSSSVLWSKYITVTGTINNTTNYTVWVNGVKASVSNDNTWSAHDVYLPPGGTAVLQARAIPNTDNSGNGTGGSGGGPSSYGNSGNPASAVANDVDLETDKPDEIIQVSDSLNRDFYVTNGATHFNSTDHFKITWLRDEPYSSDDHYVYSEPGHSGNSDKHNDYPAWPEFVYDDIFGGGTFEMTGSNDGVPFSTNDIGIQEWEPLSQHADIISTVDTTTEGLHGQSRFELHTGGKSGSHQLHLFQISCSATQFLNLLLPIPVVPIAPERIQVLGENLGSDGNVFVALPDNDTRDITPTIAGVDYYVFTNSEQKYELNIVVNNAQTLSEDRVVPDANYCVGQYLSFTPAWSPPLPGGTVKSPIQWSFGGNFVNDTWQVDCGDYDCGSINYTNNTNLLKNETTAAWWTSGGSPATEYDADVTENLIFANGQPVTIAAHGVFNMFRPTIGDFKTTVDGISPSMIVNRGTFRVQLFGNMPWRLFLNSTFDGTMAVTQLANLSGHGFFDTAGAFDIDGAEVYGLGVDTNYPDGKPYNTSDASTLAHSIDFVDNPQTQYRYHVQMIGTFKDYVRFKPSSDGSIFVTLCIINWNMNGSANYPGSPAPTLSMPPAGDPVPSEEFPVWIEAVH